MSATHNVLYVEDDPDSIVLVETALENLPQVNLVTATTGAEGIKLAQDSELHLIILDINLPDINGYEILKHLKESSVAFKVPIIAYSSQAMERQKGLEAGFTDYLVKPMEQNKFVSVVKNLLAIQ